MHIASAEVRANLTAPGGARLSVHVVLAPDENVVVTTVTSDPPMPITVSSCAVIQFRGGGSRERAVLAQTLVPTASDPNPNQTFAFQIKSFV